MDRVPPGAAYPPQQQQRIPPQMLPQGQNLQRLPQQQGWMPQQQQHHEPPPRAYQSPTASQLQMQYQQQPGQPQPQQRPPSAAAAPGVQWAAGQGAPLQQQIPAQQQPPYRQNQAQMDPLQLAQYQQVQVPRAPQQQQQPLPSGIPQSPLAAAPPHLHERLTPEQERELEKALHLLREKGYTEKNPEYANLLKIWHDRTNLVSASLPAAKPAPIPVELGLPPRVVKELQAEATMPDAIPSEFPSKPELDNPALTPQQALQLKSQIMSYRYLSKNAPVPPVLQLASEGIPSKAPVIGVDVTGTPAPAPEVAARKEAFDKRIAEASQKREEALASQTAYVIQAKAVQGKRYIVPSKNPPGLNPQLLIQVREENIRNRIQYRIRELENLPSNLPNDLKIRLMVELKALKLLDLQRKLREEVVSGTKKITTLETSINPIAYKKVKKQTIKETRIAEKLERQQQIDREQREKSLKQQRNEFLDLVCTQSNNFKIHHKNHSQKFISKIGKSVASWHTTAEKEEQKRQEKRQKERLRALKAGDDREYEKLINEEKDKRITHLLQQTDQYLAELGKSVLEEKKEAGLDNESLTKERDFYQIAHSVKESVTKQPDILVGGKLKEYQLKGLEWMISLYNNNLNGILADEMGLGKTIQTISLITFLIETKKQPGPHLVIVPLSTLTNWQLEFERWAPSVSKIVYLGSPTARKQLQYTLRTSQFNVLLTTYDFIMRDKAALTKIKWNYMIIDEGHRMKNSHCKLTQTLSQFYSSKHRLLLTGTPLQNSLPELWALLNFLLPSIFKSVKSFEEWFNAPFANTGEQLELNEEETLLVIRRLHRVLRPFMLRRLKKDVEKELPDKIEKVIKCQMSALQRKLHSQIKMRGAILTMSDGESKVQQKGLSNTIMQLRKVCNHPFVFREIEDQINPSLNLNVNLVRSSGKFDLLDRILPKFKATKHKVLMFFQMTQIMEIMEDYCKWRDYKYLRLDGGTKNEDRREAMKVWNEADSPYFIFLLSTRAGGLGLNLQSADTVIIFDSDWNPHQDLQAQDRAHRIGQKNEVRVYRLIMADSVEEKILARAQYKLDVDSKVIQAGKFDQKSTAEERDEFLKSLLEEDSQGNEEDEIFDDEELNDIIAREEKKNGEVVQTKEEQMEMFKQIDREIEAKRKEEWKSMGGKGEFTRLMEEKELPDFIVRSDEPQEISMVEEDIGRGKRQQKRVHEFFDDQLPEAQWLKLIEEGKDVQEYLRKRKERREKREQKKDQTKSTEDDDESSGSSSENEPAPPPKKKIRIAEPPTPASPISLPPGRDMKEFLNECVKYIEDSTDKSGRQRAELFLVLPSADDYPDYFEIIKRPIALDIIKERIELGQYKSVEDFTKDVDLMFSNARIYNQKGSQVYEDSLSLQKSLQTRLTKMMTPKTPKKAPVAEVSELEIESKRGRGRPKSSAPSKPTPEDMDDIDDIEEPKPDSKTPKKGGRGRKPKKAKEAEEGSEAPPGDENPQASAAGEEEPAPKSSKKKGRTPKAEAADAKTPKKKSKKKDEEDEEADQDDEPKSSKKKKEKKKKKRTEEEEDGEEEEEEAPKQKESRASSKEGSSKPEQVRLSIKLNMGSATNKAPPSNHDSGASDDEQDPPIADDSGSGSDQSYHSDGNMSE